MNVLSFVALSSVQEDGDSLRVVQRVETSQRHPPAVSEEDLSVASLLDIPSWAETMGNIHSESIHGDMIEELEINQLVIHRLTFTVMFTLSKSNSLSTLNVS